MTKNKAYKNKAYSPERFIELCNEFAKQEYDILDWKAEEYSTDEDRLQNFHEIAAFIGDRPTAITPSVIALIYMLKHIQSVKNAIISGRINWCWEAVGGEGLKQRIADSRNYHMLLAACLEEENEEARGAACIDKDATNEPLSAVCSLRKS